jgi:hypothetical protein
LYRRASFAEREDGLDSDHFSFFFLRVIIDSGPGVVTHRRSFYASCVLFKINAERGTTERDEMMMFSFDSFFVYNNTRKKRGEKTHTRTNTEKTNRASVLSKSLEYGSSETKTETVREFTRAFTLDQFAFVSEIGFK